MKKQVLFSLIAVAVLILTGCAHPHQIASCLPTAEEPSGFWFGTWNGMTMFFSLIGSAFSNNITIYDVNNNGWFYNFGFVCGFSAIINSIKFIVKLLKATVY